MSFAKKLGPEYESLRVAAKIKTITVALNDVECNLKIRIPVKREMEEITERISTGDQATIEKIYSKLAEPLLKTMADADAEFLEVLKTGDQRIEKIDNDLMVNGTSVRQIATLMAAYQNQVEIYFSLIQSPTGEPVNESYDDIADEFPEHIIREIVKKIDEAIRPNYGDTKKN